MMSVDSRLDAIFDTAVYFNKVKITFVGKPQANMASTLPWKLVHYICVLV